MLTAKSSLSRRKRIEREAVKSLDTARLTPARRRNAIARIRAAKQPRAEARRIVDQSKRDEVRGIAERDEFDLSDVQELRARLIRRDGGIWSPHTDMLARMDRAVATGAIDRPKFKDMAGVVLAMGQTMPQSARA